MNTAVTPLSMRLTASAGAAANPVATALVRRLAHAAYRTMSAVAAFRARAQLLELADNCEALQPALARELRAASRLGPLV